MEMNRREVSGGGSDKFIKFKDGESKALILCGKIYEFYTKWVNGKSVATTPDDPEGKPRFRVNVAIKGDDNEFHMKIWEFPLTVYNMLADVNEEYPLESIVIKITRKGMDLKTEYHVLPLVSDKFKLIPTLRQQIAALQLNILNPKQQPKQASSDSHAPPSWDDDPGPDEEIPF